MRTWLIGSLIIIAFLVVAAATLVFGVYILQTFIPAKAIPLVCALTFGLVALCGIFGSDVGEWARHKFSKSPY